MPALKVRVATVLGNDRLTAAVRSLAARPDGRWSFIPGQVAELSIGAGTEGYFAVASAPLEGLPIRFLVKADGSASAGLMRLTPGSVIGLRGPFGAGFDLPADPGQELLFVTAGSAIAAVRSALVQALSVGPATRITLVLGLRRPEDLCLGAELAAWYARGVAVLICVSAGELTLAHPLPVMRGRVQVHLTGRAGPTTHAFVAGTEELEDQVTLALAGLGVEPRHIQRNYRPDHRESPPRSP